MSAMSRRTVVRGAAWTVPVLAVAAHAPAFAASTDAPRTNGPASYVVCKLAGAGQNCQSYRVTLTLDVQPDDTWDITLTEVTFNGTLTTFMPVDFVVRFDNRVITFEFCTDNKSPSHFDIGIKFTARNRRTGVSSAVADTASLTPGTVKNC